MYRSIDSTKIRNLKVIAMLKHGQRLRTRTQFYSIDDYSLMTIYKAGIRYITGESRTETIDAITRLIESCVQQANILEAERIRLSNQLKEVLIGITNLYITYKDDSTACAGLDYITELIEAFIIKQDRRTAKILKHEASFNNNLLMANASVNANADSNLNLNSNLNANSNADSNSNSNANDVDSPRSHLEPDQIDLEEEYI